jgi:hypothetical protein
MQHTKKKQLKLYYIIKKDGTEGTYKEVNGNG